MFNAPETRPPLVTRSAIWLWTRLRPNAGWLPFALLIAITAIFVTSLRAPQWAPQLTIIPLNAAVALLMATALANAHTPTWRAWLLLTAYGAILTVVQTAQLLPFEVRTNEDIWPAIALSIRSDLALWLDRLNGWGRAVVSGGDSSDTLPFIIVLGLLVWITVAFLAWQTMRDRNPLTALGLMGVAIAINAFFAGERYAIWVALFVGLALALTGVMRYLENEARWRRTRIDFSPEVRYELFFVIAAVSIALFAAALVLPSLRSARLNAWFNSLPVVQSTEDAFARAFVSIEARRRGLGSDGFRDGPGGAGVLPREFLIGEAPDLYETVVMTATVSGDAVAPHWWGVSMDTYTGRGWARSEERSEEVSAETPLALPNFRAQTTLTQTVSWQLDRRATRYSLGLPATFDQDVVALWRGVDDLARVQSVGALTYTLTSRISSATVRQLRAARIDQTPLTISARYTALPDDIPERVRLLAEDITSGLSNPYDQTVAIEQFLRQYPYDLGVPPPAPEQDVVDYFLFDAQAGYCDYYASAMVVLARSIGLPARLAVGYLAQPPDENGVQTIRQINGHSWAEVYFAPYGWIEFEPTAAFSELDRPEGSATTVDGAAPNLQRDEERPAPAPIPQRRPQDTSSSWWMVGVGGILLAASVAGVWLLRHRRAPLDDVTAAYAHLHHSAARLGIDVEPSATPYEFRDALASRLLELRDHRWSQRSARLATRIDATRRAITPLVAAYVLVQYGGAASNRPNHPPSLSAWRRVRATLWLLRWLR